ncbi:uncharacterized protein LOC143607562 [Bidens hawaiensis]|uniref:uncharacterized protein LOC143607562 n=1 Tax=Bidens hawaiensis TaxID=980011 RepID=UPI004049C497
MADPMAKETQISIKVFVDKVKKRVVYAEADHTFVDILFSFMTLPLGTIVRLLGKLDDSKSNPLGSLNKLNLKLKIDDTDLISYFICGHCMARSSTYSCYFSICNKAKCTRCGELMNCSRPTASNVCVGGGVFVSDLATFIVTDDFSVMPYSTAGIFGLFTDCGITDRNHLEEKKLEMGSKQMLYLLKLALSLDSPLTHFIYHQNNPFQDEHFQFGSTFDPFAIMTKETSAGPKIFFDVTLQKSTGKLLFAETKEDFVDFLFGTLATLKVSGYTYDLKDPRLNGKLIRPSGLFFVTDDFIISPSSSHLAMNTLEKFKVPFPYIERHFISFGLEEGLRMLKASLRSKSFLSSILKHLLKD